jgi:hypothetical protein
MMWDDEDRDLAYLDYLAEHESGFLSDVPPRIIGTEEALRRIAFDSGATMTTLHDEDED